MARSAGPVPVSGAWVPGDPPGRREFAPVGRGRSFQLEAGGRLSEVVVAYETWGELNAAASNAVLVPHALTGDSHACLLYTSDAADERSSVDLGGRRIIKQQKHT